MIFRYLLRDLFRQLPQWDAASKLSLIVALVLLFALLWLGFTGPLSVRFPARVGAFGLLLALQLILFWGNRRRISPYHQAQHHFSKGDYAAARDLLEQIPESGRTSVDALILLGNTYRHLGEYGSADSALQRALELRPDYHYAIYAAAKLRLVTGQFEEAQTLFELALRQGAPELVTFDAGLACMLAGEGKSALPYFSRYCAANADEPEKAMLAKACLSLRDKPDTPQTSLTRDAVAFWRYEADKHAATPYGAELHKLLDQIESAA